MVIIMVPWGCFIMTLTWWTNLCCWHQVIISPFNDPPFSDDLVRGCLDLRQTDKVHCFAWGKSLMYQQGKARQSNCTNQEKASQDEGRVDRGLKQGGAFQRIVWMCPCGWSVKTFWSPTGRSEAPLFTLRKRFTSDSLCVCSDGGHRH